MLTEPRNSKNAIALFEKALEEPNEFIRQAAAEELANIMYHGTELSKKTIRLARSNAAGSWAAAFEASENLDREKALSFLLGFQHGEFVPNEARLFTIQEFERQELPFSEIELAAIHGHLPSCVYGTTKLLLSFGSL